MTLSSVKSVVIFFGPMLLPKAISYYKSHKNGAARQGRPIRPLPLKVSRALGILFVVAIIALIATFSTFAPENIFAKTQSRVQIPVDVLFTRLNVLRPHGLTAFDNQLRHKLRSLESKLLYLKFGPDALANCLFCAPDDHKSYVYYSLPAMLTPHLFNAAVLALVTSGLFVGPEGAVWRRFATLGAVILASFDLYFLSQSDYQQNAKKARLEDLDMFFWRSRMWRYIAITVLDATVGWMMYLSSTNRAFVVPHSPAERLAATGKQMDSLRSKMSAMGIVKNTVSRDQALRARTDAYWVHEGKLMGEMLEDKEVMESINNAVESRVKLDKISDDAEDYAKNVIGGIAFVQSET